MDNFISIWLSNGSQAIVDPVDADLAQYKWRLNVNKSRDDGYARSTAAKKLGSKSPVLMHRIILGRKLGRDLKPSESVDHINQNKLDNRRINLRLASRADNKVNTKAGRRSHFGFKGLSPYAGRWRACLRYGGKLYSLGIHVDPVDAAKAYDAKIAELHGRFAVFNFPEQWVYDLITDQWVRVQEANYQTL